MKLLVFLAIVHLVVILLWRRKGSPAKSFQGIFDLIGCVGTAEDTFTTEGKVIVKGEIWKATSRTGIVHKGEPVRVVRLRDGLVLEVEKLEDVSVS